MPETKPDFGIDNDGICSGCRYYEQREEVDWEKRKSDLFEILNIAKLLPTIKFVIYGNGHLRKELERAIHYLQIKNG